MEGRAANGKGTETDGRGERQREGDGSGDPFSLLAYMRVYVYLKTLAWVW